jgi:alginate O-acetyltransferase complex protein AlgI
VLQIFLYIAVFLVEVTIFASVRSRAVRQTSLLVASYALYLTWQPWFAAVLLLSTLMNYGVGQALRRRPAGSTLGIGILLNLLLLGSFKYLPPVAAQLPFSSLQPFAHLALPLGISFWTFQAMSYLFDLYRGEELDPSLAEFALYMAFFPVTISGPVCRMPDMLPQFRSEAVVPWSDRERGFSRIAIGVLMMQVAKLLGRGVLGGVGIAAGFDRLTHWSGSDVWCLAFGYGLQLFFDFAGYSHIAIGAAQVLGFTLPENFAHPFASDSPSVFWTRWHMSLSFWIRDYVFLPLAVLRRDLWWRNLVLVIAMVLFGIWHKATLLLVLWGCYHGCLLVLHRQIQQLERRLSWTPPEAMWNLVSWVATTICVGLGWIFFRANSPAQAAGMIRALASPVGYSSHALDLSLYLLVFGIAAGYAIVLQTAEALDRSAQRADKSQSGFFMVLAQRRWYWLPALYTVALLLVVLITQTQGASTSQFMYRTF